MSSILRSSKFVRYVFGLARSIIISNRQELDGNLLQRSHHLAGLFTNNVYSGPLNIQSGSSLEKTVRQLDEDARRTGRVSVNEIEEALYEIKNIKKASASQSLMVIRCCGNLVPEEIPEQRTKLVEEIWNTLKKLGVSLDISHYNALLKVYLENEHKFSPTEFLAELEKQGVEPNRVTYQRLIAGYCQQGDIAGATKILEFMKDKQLPVSEGVFNALILGHSKADDMESAEGILSVMRQANLEPSNETYMTLLSGYAQRGDKEAVDRLLTECKLKDVLLSDRDFLEMAYSAALGGHDELTDEILKLIRHSMGYNQEAANVLLRLITAGKDEAAYKVFQTMSSSLRNENIPNMSGHIFLKQLIKRNKPANEILQWCERLEKDGHTKLGLWIAVETSFHHNNTDLTLGLLRALRQKGEPIRPHYFWPSLVTAGKTSNINSMNDILKKMLTEFEVSVASDTLKEYYLPYLPHSQTPQDVLSSLINLGVRPGQAVVGIISHLVSKQRLKEASDLAHQYPGLNFRSQLTTNELIDVMVNTGDVANVVGLLHVMAFREEKDEEEDVGDAGEELVSRFLVNVAGYTPAKKFITEVLKEMLDCGLAISNVCAEAVESRLQGGQMTSEISDLLTKLSSGDVKPKAIRSTSSSAFALPRGPDVLERIKQRMKENNEPQEKIIGITRSLFSTYYQEGDLENALRIKKEWEEELKQEITPGMWAMLLDLNCTNNKLEAAKDCLEMVKTSTSDFSLDAPKILKLAKLYIQNNLFDEGLSVLKTVKPRERGEGLFARGQAWQALQATAEITKDPEQVKTLLNTLVDLKYIEISNAMLGPVMKAYLLRDDLEGALKEFENCVSMYRATPWKNELAQRFIEKEDATNLQTLVDLSTQVHGEVNSLYDLVLSFIECGRIRQARKVLETPGLSSRNNRIQIACERYKKEGQTAALEGLIEATKDVPFVDRSEIYYNLLETYCEAEDVDKALGLWTKMQDEDVNVTDAFLSKLGNFLKGKGLQVPFEIPKTDKSVSNTTTAVKQEKSETKNSSLLSSAIRTKNVDEALKIKDDLENSGKQLTKREVYRLMELLVEKGRFRESVSFLVSLKDDQLPPIRLFNFLITRLAGAGELELMKRLEQQLSEENKKFTSFSNRYLGAAVVAGKTKEELDKMEKEIDAASSPEEIDHLVEKFPRGGIIAVLESSPTYLEQVSRIVDKYHSKGAVGPANALVMFHLSAGNDDKARELYQHYNIANGSQIMFRSVLSKARITQNPQLLEKLIALLQGAPSITPEIQGIFYSNLINIYSSLGKFETALGKLEEGLKAIPIEHFYTNTLVKLKDGLEASNIPFKYTIPPKKINDSSSSSSSSETEQKKSTAANR